MEVRDELPQSLRMQMKLEHHHDLNKYYFYHRDYDHDIKDCLYLRDEIERLIRQRRLNHFIRGRVPPQ